MKFTKRIATLLMALAMMLCLTVPAFAAEPAAQAKLIVTGAQLKDKTVHATKMFTASWVDSNNDGKIDTNDKLSYTLDTAWEGLFWANGMSTESTCPTDSIDVSAKEGATLNEKAVAYLSAMTADSTELNTFAAKAAKYKTTKSIADTKTATGDSIKRIASGNDIVAVDVVGKFFIQLGLRIDFTGFCQLISVAAVYADILDPAVPCIHIQTGEGTIYRCVSLHRVDNAQRAKNVIDADQAAQNL